MIKYTWLGKRPGKEETILERTEIIGRTMDEERALYNLRHGDVRACVFAGPADGESALKEARDILVSDCRFSLRYPLWHVHTFRMEKSAMDDKTRAALWYARDGRIEDCDLLGVKAVRECQNIRIENCRIVSAEFGWKCRDISLIRSGIEAEYLFLDSRQIRLQDVRMKGKYSFQYVDGLEIDNCHLDTKDAFWHSKNVTVRGSVIKGEYLAWFSENLTLIDCTVIGTQPLCYCQGLKMIRCTMIDADLAFEYSDVEADIIGEIISVKNPRSGRIVADKVGENIREDAVMECTGEVALRGEA